MKGQSQRSIILYQKWKKPLQRLSLEQKGRILDALLNFPEAPEFEDDMLVMAWDFISDALAENAQKWDETREKRSVAGRKGAESTNSKRQQKAANPANADFAEQKQQKAANPAVSVSGTVSVSESVSVISPNGGVYTDAPLPPESKSKKFSPPDVETVKSYFAEKGGTEGQAIRFHAYYESNGWKVGRNPMKSWKAAVTGWISRDREQHPKKPALGVQPQTTAQAYADIFRGVK